MTTITSIKDDRIVFVRRILSFSKRIELGYCVVYGISNLDFIIEKNNSKIEYILYDDSCDDSFRTNLLLKKNTRQVLSVSSGVYRKISRPGTNVLAVVKNSVGFTKATENSHLLVMDNIKDFGNIGSLVRTACAFGVRRVLFISKDKDLFSYKTIESSRGLVFDIEYVYAKTTVGALSLLKSIESMIIVSGLYNCEPIGDKNKISSEFKSFAFVVGNETSGVSKKFFSCAHQRVTIPLASRVESLNVVVACGIILYKFLLD